MNHHRLPGDVTIALSHFALAGLAAIAGEAAGTPTRLWWTEGQPPEATVATSLDQNELADAVHAHADRAAAAGSWLNRRDTSGRRSGAGLFTARAKAPGGEEEWHGYATARRAARRSTPIDSLDGRMILGMGEPAWWRCDGTTNRPDDGASRWEMKTRNKGQEFLLHRLVPLAEAVAARTPEQILDGLHGRTVVDETGNNSPDSRTSTGLTTPGPVDSAIAWCALWGLSLAPPIPRKTAISRTPGVWPGDRLHPTWAALPVFTNPVSPTRYSQILMSRAFDTLGGSLSGTTSSADIDRETAATWLVEQGIRAVVTFPILKTGSSNAPERQILAGNVTVLR